MTTQKLPILEDVESIRLMIDNGSLLYHHTASRKGYLPVCSDLSIEPYIGKYGRGYIICHTNRRAFVNGHRTNNYYRIDYYIIK